MALDGRLYHPGDAGFEAARVDRLFNRRRPSRQPAAVLEAASEADVVAGIRLAREHGWTVSVRSGGHSWPAWSVREDALLIDLGRLRGIELDPSSGLVSAGPAATGAELHEALAPHGLMFQSGHHPGVGLGGYLLQGGTGWNTRGWGWACERIRALDVVTADGEVLRVDADRHPDLLWAARGAGHGFPGVVTRFVLEPRPLPAAITMSTYVYPAALFDEVLTWMHGIQTSVAPTVEFGLVASHAPGTAVPVVLVYALAFCDTAAEAAAALAPFARCPVVGQAVMRVDAQPTTIEEQYATIAAQNPEHLRYQSDSAWITAGAAETAEALHGAFAGLPNVTSDSLWLALAPQRELPDMAFSLRGDAYFATFAKYEDAADDAAYAAWIADRMDDVAPISDGLFLGDCDLAVREGPFLTADSHRRLEEVRAGRDPDGLFCSYMTARDLASAAARRDPSALV